MAAPLREQLKNNAASALNGGITASVTSLNVADGSVFPSTGNFRLICDSEIMLCTARSTNTLTVVRGQEGTAAASHSDGADITHILTQGGLDRWAQDNVPLWGYSSLLPLSKIVDDAGTATLAAADFTWVNQGTASVTDQAGTVLMRMPTASGENVRIQKRTAPAAPYSYIIGFHCVLPSGGSGDIVQAYAGFRQSSTGKLCVVGVASATSGGNCLLAAYNLTSPTVFSAPALHDRTPCCLIGASAVWFKIEDDNTNLKFYVSGDGLEWILFDSVARGSHMTGGPDEVFWGGNNTGNGDNEALVRLVHWSRNS